MKPIVVLLLVGLFAQVVSAQDTEKKEPAALTKAREDYQRDILPITRKYIGKLESLKKELGGRGDLDGATAVQAEIDAVKPDDDGVRKDWVAGTWRGVAGTSVRKFAGGKVTASDTASGASWTGTYETKSSTEVVIHGAPDGVRVYTLQPDKTLSVGGNAFRRK